MNNSIIFLFWETNIVCVSWINNMYGFFDKYCNILSAKFVPVGQNASRIVYLITPQPEAIPSRNRWWKWWSPLAIYSAITKYRGVLMCVSCWINEFARHLFMDILWQNMDVIVWNIYFPMRFVLFYIQHTSSCNILDVK